MSLSTPSPFACYACRRTSLGSCSCCGDLGLHSGRSAVPPCWRAAQGTLPLHDPNEGQRMMDDEVEARRAMAAVRRSLTLGGDFDRALDRAVAELDSDQRERVRLLVRQRRTLIVGDAAGAA